MTEIHIYHLFLNLCCLIGHPFNRDGPVRSMSQTPAQSIDAAGSMLGMYNHLGRSDSIGSAHSLGGISINSESNLSYNRLDRLPSWGSQSSGQRGEQYNRLNPVPSGSSMVEGSYDRLARSPSVTSRTLTQSMVSGEFLQGSLALFLMQQQVLLMDPSAFDIDQLVNIQDNRGPDYIESHKKTNFETFGNLILQLYM